MTTSDNLAQGGIYSVTPKPFMPLAEAASASHIKAAELGADWDAMVAEARERVRENEAARGFRDHVESEFIDGLKLFLAKNADYGSSFEDVMNAYAENGIDPNLAALPRLLDKSGRATNLTLGATAQVESERIIDTLRDAGTYCFMWAAWLSMRGTVES